jgi:PKD repeat protein
MNQTQFSGEGYQKASFTVLFENITYAYEDRLCDSIWTGFGANENKNLNATFLLDTFSTDAPGTIYNVDSHSFEFNWGRSNITLNRVYNFSIVIRVVPNGTSPVIYKPYFGVVLFNGNNRNSGTSGTSTTMPDDMLPPHLTYATASQNVSLIWSYYLLFGKGASFDEIKTKVSSAPVANFSGTPTTGTAPLTVTFKDSSRGSPTGWAWYFGDESYTAPWTRVNASAGWSARYEHSSVAMPDGSIVLMGGYDGNPNYKDDTWRSTNNGTTWTLVNASSGWSARYHHTSVAMVDGSIVLMGGYDGGYKNDTWRSMDNGATWTLVNASSGWSGRQAHTSVAMVDGSIVLMGGYDVSGNYKNDTWRSMNNGTTWTRVNASSGWSARADHTSVSMPDGSIVLITGVGSDRVKNDTWRSKDNGATWIQMNASAGDSARFVHTSVAMPDGSIVLMGGYDSGGFPNSYTWRSTDNGATWTLVNTSAGCMARGSHSSVAMPDGSIVLMGGRVKELMNDTWRFQPAGASAQNPSHTYTKPGIYQVALQAYNAGGYDSMRKAGYITVTSSTTKVGVFRPSVHTFYLKNGTTTTINWGVSTDLPVTGDWNGDGRTDVGVFRNPTHTFILKNGTTTTSINWGTSTDLPVTGDWNGDGRTEVGVFRNSTHTFYLKNGTTTTSINWGTSTDKPVTGDWNGDGRTEVGVFRPSVHTFYLKNGTTTTAIGWGVSTDKPVTGDWNGDGRTDVGVFRPSVHTFYLKNGTTTTSINWGVGTDLPVTGKWS